MIALAAIAAGVVIGAGSPLGIVLFAVAAVMVATSAIGFCPLYSPAAFRQSRPTAASPLKRRHDGCDHRELRARGDRALARASRRRRFLGRLVRPLPHARPRDRARGRGARRRVRARQARRRRRPGARAPLRDPGHPGREGLPRRRGRARVRRRPAAGGGRPVPRRADRPDRGRAACRRAHAHPRAARVVTALEQNEHERAFELLLERSAPPTANGASG